MAAHHLGRAWRDGLGVLPDDKEAEYWFRQSAEAGVARSQYALGTFLQEQGRVEEAREKKIAMGHKPEDHEEYRGPSLSM